ncbi:MAG: hypothetical protein ACR2KV_00380 [Solirubrobacteraceae bacterium]
MRTGETCLGLRQDGQPCREWQLWWRGYCRRHIPAADLHDAALWLWDYRQTNFFADLACRAHEADWCGPCLGSGDGDGCHCKRCLAEAMSEALGMRPYVADQLIGRLAHVLGIGELPGICSWHGAATIAVIVRDQPEPTIAAVATPPQAAISPDRYFDDETEALHAAAVITRALGDGQRHPWREVFETVEDERNLAPQDARDISYRAFRALAATPGFRFSWSGRQGERTVRMTRTTVPAQTAEAAGVVTQPPGAGS